MWVGKFSKISVGPVTAEGSRSPPRALFGQFWSKSRPTGDHTTFLCSKGPKHCPQMTGWSCLYFGSNLSVILISVKVKSEHFDHFAGPRRLPRDQNGTLRRSRGQRKFSKIFQRTRVMSLGQIGCEEFISAVKTRR